MAALKQQCDYVIVLYHGGKEHYRYSSPNLQRICRKLVDKGADLVVCQHTHCIGCEEKYQGGTIVYGQGNFLFDGSEDEHWQTSLLIRIADDFTVTYIPLIKRKNVVRLAEGDEARDILQGFEKRSEEILVPDMIENKYREYAGKSIESYLRCFSGKRNLLFRALNKVTGHRLQKIGLKRKYDRQQILALQDYIMCEAHSELILEGLKERLK